MNTNGPGIRKGTTALIHIPTDMLFRGLSASTWLSLEEIVRTLLVVLTALVGTAAYGMGMMHGGGMMSGSMVRHHYVMQNGIDPSYASKANPLNPTDENIAEGKRLYEQNCAACHGPKGLGDGPAGKSLNPPPADIAATVQMPIATDGFLYWTIAEGGTLLGTAMPPYKGVLKEDQIWQLVTYLRVL